MLEREPAVAAPTSRTGTRRRIGPGAGVVVGPAFVAAVAYIDPGNFATNITAGAHYGYALLWVILVANVMAMLIQYLSAKLGVITGRDLAEMCRERLPRPVSYVLWVQAELVAMATDLAEFVGAAIGLNLLFGVPMPIAGLLTAVVAFGILALEQRGYRKFELAIAGMFGIVFLGFAYNLLWVGADPAGVASGLVPTFAGPQGVLLAVGIIGATVMPHAIYLHSALTKIRGRGKGEEQRRSLLRKLRIDVIVALGIAGFVNASMLILAASLLHSRGLGGADPILLLHADLGRYVGGGAALVFAVALLSSGLSSSSVGTYAGQVVMRGFIQRNLPLFFRRGLTMLPALVVLSLGLPPTDSLIISQVVLSFGIPFALIPLVLLTRSREVMGPFTNRRITTALASCCAVVIIALNAYLLIGTFIGV